MPARRTALLAVWVLFALLLPSAGDAVASADAVTFVGGGLGHGVGLSQYGALGQAEEGRDGETIARHYFPGTRTVDIGAHPLEDPVLLTVERPLWVNLVRSASSTTLTAIGAPATVTTSAGVATIGAGRTWTVSRDASGCRWSEGATVMLEDAACRADVAWPAGGRLRVGGIELADATVHLRADGVAAGRFHVSAALDLETYLRGVHEMPSWWPPAAQQAQAIVARTYAVWRFSQREVGGLRSGDDPGFTSYRKAMCWCHLYATTYDQRYQGGSWEDDPAAAGWRAAVAATAGRILVYDGPDAASTTRAGVIAAFYGSSTFGRTSDNVAGLGSPTAYPYLASVDDAWSADPARNPYARWERTFTLDRLAVVLGWDEVSAVTLERPAPDTLVRFSGRTAGRDVTVVRGGAWLRTALGLPSPQVIAVDGATPSSPTTTTSAPSTTTTMAPIVTTTTTSTVAAETSTTTTSTTSTTSTVAAETSTTTTTAQTSTTTSTASASTAATSTTTTPRPEGPTTTDAGPGPSPSEPQRSSEPEQGPASTSEVGSPDGDDTGTGEVRDDEGGDRSPDAVDGTAPTPIVLFRIDEDGVEPVHARGSAALAPDGSANDHGPGAIGDGAAVSSLYGVQAEDATETPAPPTAGTRPTRTAAASSHLALGAIVGAVAGVGEAAILAASEDVARRVASGTAGLGAVVSGAVARSVTAGTWHAGLPPVFVLLASSFGLRRRLRRPSGRHRAPSGRRP